MKINSNRLNTMITVYILEIAFVAALVLCWAGNMIRLSKCDFEPSYKAEIIYAAGIVTPTCLVTVWMDLEKDIDKTK